MQILDSPALPLTRDVAELAKYRNSLRKLTLKLALTHGILPVTLVLKGVRCQDTDMFGSGGFADVFIGTYRGQKVALKRLRVTMLAMSSQKQRIQQVSHPNVSGSPQLTSEYRAYNFSVVKRCYGKTWSTITYCRSLVFRTTSFRVPYAWFYPGWTGEV